MKRTPRGHAYNGPYRDDCLNHVAFPLGGIGAGMICLEGTGCLSHVSLRNRPEVFNEPAVFSAISLQGENPVARILEGPVPSRKIFGVPSGGNGLAHTTYGLPRCSTASFAARFPFATVELSDPALPLDISLTGWSPFIPGDADNSSLPAAALEFTFVNRARHPVNALYSLNMRNFLAVNEGNPAVAGIGGGFILREEGPAGKPWEQAALAVCSPDAKATVNCRWFRGGWWDPLTMAWKAVEKGRPVANPPYDGKPPSPGATLFVPLRLKPGQKRTIPVLLAWYAPLSNLRIGADPQPGCSGEECCCAPAKTPETFEPWYAGRFDGVEEVMHYWREHYRELRAASSVFSECLYDTTLPPEVTEAVAANLTILKSPTVLRQTDGRLWSYEGCGDNSGCCHGSCTHVWNYAQALPHLFPSLERTLRETEFTVNQDERGHQTFRSSLPIRPVAHDWHAAADGQLGGIMKCHREWRVSGDTGWLRRLWPGIKAGMDFCIRTWDPEHDGVLREPHHNTYDIEFWGADAMCTTFYLGALAAAAAMGRALADDVPLFAELLAKGRAYLEKKLWNGEYFFQRIEWEGLRAANPIDEGLRSGTLTEEAADLLRREGPKYQYGNGCLSDGVLGIWIAAMCGLDDVIDPAMTHSHLKAVHRHNFRKDFSAHANPQRPGYALGNEGGLLLCSWPEGGRLSLPFPYSDEVWTGIEYQVASHLIMHGEVAKGLEIVRTCRDRYDGRVRNPFNEYECGHWYARAMSSYGLLQALTGARYDAVEKTLYLAPAVTGDFRAFLSTETGWGTVGVRKGKPFVAMQRGSLDVRKVEYTPHGKR